MVQDYNNQIKGFRVQTQIPLHVKGYSESEDTLKSLGESNNLAYIYEQGLRVYCIEEGTRWEWREVLEGEENTGLMDSDFTYPTSLPEIFGINYSNRTFNFFPTDADISNLATKEESRYERVIITTGVKQYIPIEDKTFTIKKVIVTVFESQNIGSVLTFDVKYNGTSIFSIKPTIDNGETTSTTAVIQSVLSNSSGILIPVNGILTFTVETIGTSKAKAPVFTLIGERGI